MTTFVRNAIVLSSLAVMLPVSGCTVEGEKHRTQTSGVSATCIVIAEPTMTSKALGSEDAGPLDAGTPDAGPSDDGGPVDAGTPDAGPSDDGGPVDAGTPDAGPSDGGTPDAGETTIEFCGCQDPLTGEFVDCEPMEYPPICPQDEQAVVVANPITASYAGTTPPVAYYTCGDGTCEGSGSPPVYVVTTEEFVAEFVSDTQLSIYAVPTGADAVQSPNGRFLFPLLQDTESFADLSRPVSFSYQGTSYTRYLDIQNDCMPVAGRCLCFRC